MGSMTPRRYPLRETFWLAVFAVGFIWVNMVIMACLWVDKPVGTLPISLAVIVLMLVSAAKGVDRYIWVREHLLAERKLAREFLALQACAVVLNDRIYRGVRVYGTGLHRLAQARKRRALAAMSEAKRYRALRHGLK